MSDKEIMNNNGKMYDNEKMYSNEKGYTIKHHNENIGA